MEYESIKNNSRIIGKFSEIKMVSEAPSEILDSYNNGEQDDLSLGDESNSRIL